MNLGSYGFPQGGQGSTTTASTSGRFLRMTAFTANGTWTNMNDASFIVVMVLGAGGGSGGAEGRANVSTFGGSGAGGGGAIKTILAAALGATEAVSVGVGGVAGTNAPTSGSQGGTTSFGSHCSATGGAGGSHHTSLYAYVSGASALGGMGMSGDVNFTGSPGFPAGYMYAHPAWSLPGGNGALPIGGPGAPGTQSSIIGNFADGRSANANSGGGASGGAAKYDDLAKVAGGTGGSGLCVVYEYS